MFTARLAQCEGRRRLCKKAGPSARRAVSQQPSLRERDPVVSTVANDDVVVNRKVEKPARLHKLAREPDILSTRRRVAAWMVVNEQERGSALPQRWPEDLSRVGERGVWRANGHFGVHQVAELSVQEDRPDVLAAVVGATRNVDGEL